MGKDQLNGERECLCYVSGRDLVVKEEMWYRKQGEAMICIRQRYRIEENDYGDGDLDEHLHLQGSRQRADLPQGTVC